MNKARRQQIEDIKARIAILLTQAETIKCGIELICSEEQDYRDNLPDSLAGGEKGQKSDAAIEALEQVIEDLESLIETDFIAQLDIACQ
jgi:prefoldin subunit 5